MGWGAVGTNIDSRGLSLNFSWHSRGTSPLEKAIAFAFLDGKFTITGYLKAFLSSKVTKALITS